MSELKETTAGVLAEFTDPGAILKAAAAVKEAGYSKFDTHTPFPIHGMDKAMGLGESPLGFFVAIAAVIGGSTGYFIQYWMGEVDYALNISGKPFFALQSSVPVIFELTILFSALTAVFGMFIINKLPKPYNVLFNSERFERATDDGFFLFIEAADDKFNEEKTAADLKALGAVHLETVVEYE